MGRFGKTVIAEFGQYQSMKQRPQYCRKVDLQRFDERRALFARPLDIKLDAAH